MPKVIKRPAEQRSQTDLESEREERKFIENQALLGWWSQIVEDPRFRHVRRAIERRKSLRGKIQASPHAQHVADGFRQGFAEALDILESIAFTTPITSGQSGGNELEQAQDEELQDGRRDHAADRFSR